jgi:hypothetical protein
MCLFWRAYDALFTIFPDGLRLLVLAGMHPVYLVGTLLKSSISSIVSVNDHFNYDGMTAAWKHVVGAV